MDNGITEEKMEVSKETHSTPSEEKNYGERLPKKRFLKGENKKIFLLLGILIGCIIVGVLLQPAKQGKIIKREKATQESKISKKLIDYEDIDKVIQIDLPKNYKDMSVSDGTAKAEKYWKNPANKVSYMISILAYKGDLVNYGFLGHEMTKEKNVTINDFKENNKEYQEIQVDGEKGYFTTYDSLGNGKTTDMEVIVAHNDYIYGIRMTGMDEKENIAPIDEFIMKRFEKTMELVHFLK